MISCGGSGGGGGGGVQQFTDYDAVWKPKILSGTINSISLSLNNTPILFKWSLSGQL